MKSEKQPVIERLEALEPLLESSLSKEMKSLIELLRKFKSESVADLTKAIEPLRKEFFASPQALAARIQAYQDSKAKGEIPEETVDDLVRDFSTAAAKTIKDLSKKLGVHFVDKKSAPLFRRWLETGETPPSEEELLAGSVQSYVDTARAILNESSDELTKDAFDRILGVADSVYKDCKLAGLKLFVVQLGFDVQKKTKAEILKSFKLGLTDLAMTRHKRTQILG